MLCSGDLGEVTEAERLDDMRLYGCGPLVHGIGAECGADRWFLSNSRGRARFNWAPPKALRSSP
jgi:hypothetical protein